MCHANGRDQTVTNTKPLSCLLSSSSSSSSFSSSSSSSETGQTEETTGDSLTRGMIWKTWIPLHHQLMVCPVKFELYRIFWDLTMATKHSSSRTSNDGVTYPSPCVGLSFELVFGLPNIAKCKMHRIWHFPTSLQDLLGSPWQSLLALLDVEGDLHAFGEAVASALMPGHLVWCLSSLVFWREFDHGWFVVCW